ncbi:MAG: DUF86 domain-containing protein [Eubacterium sp.]|nr:DUF86 domain-containing protein [Eubacterium sp.]
MKRFDERDIDNLHAILDHCDRIEATYERIGESYQTFLDDPDYRDAILMNIVQLGEAANRLSDECRDVLSDLPWSNIIGTRNIIVHGYAQVDNQIIWDIAIRNVPDLKETIEKVL